MPKFHIFRPKTYYKPTFCDLCKKMLLGVYHQGVQCETCDQNYHKTCIENVARECLGKHALPDLRPASLRNKQAEIETEQDEKSDQRLAVQMSITAIKKQAAEIAAAEAATTTSGDAVGPVPINQRRGSKLMTLQRTSKGRDVQKDGQFWCGYMTYYTESRHDLALHYWILTSNKLTIHKSDRSRNISLDEIDLASVKSSNLCGVDSKEKYLKKQKCYFKIETDRDTYYGGVDPNLTTDSMNVLASNFYNMFKIVYLPYKKPELRKNDSDISISAPQYESNIADKYVIDKNGLLGSGAFGQVYSGYDKETKQVVAIKAIEKSRLIDKGNPKFTDRNFFQNEFSLLSSIKLPGVIRLFSLFDERDYLYVVTEKLSCDMLDKVLKSPDGRLTERQTKFFMFQVFAALEKLHRNNIAHCDLKPENILLVKNEEFPQLKICDFGYAKVISDGSIRRSVIGTPAYSPPEIKDSPKVMYNSSVDIWSMGVIFYVSISGEFPFEEDQDIIEQLMDFKHFFNPDPWDRISKESINLVLQLMEVKLNRRLTASKALENECFTKDDVLMADLKDLEKRVGQVWLTGSRKSNVPQFDVVTE